MKRNFRFYITFENSYKRIAETCEISEKHFTKIIENLKTPSESYVTSQKLCSNLYNWKKTNRHGINNGIKFFQLPNKIRNVGSSFSACCEKTKKVLKFLTRFQEFNRKIK